jgi:hypothetical protein
MKRIVLSGAILLVNAGSAFALSCISGVSAEEDPVGHAFRRASAVFAGKVVSAGYKDGFINQDREAQMRFTREYISYQVWVVTFEVERVWKGVSTESINIVTDRTRDDVKGERFSSDDLPLELDRRYLVYAYGNEGQLTTGVCTRTRSLSFAEEDLKWLGRGDKVAASPIGR